MTCFHCGAPCKVRCACSLPICPRHQFFYMDDTNAAINRAAVAKCAAHAIGRRSDPRPYTRIGAIRSGEWFLEMDQKRDL